MHTWWTFIADASLLVKLIVIILIAASIVSWGYIFQHYQFIKKMQQASTLFEHDFSSSTDLYKLFIQQKQHKLNQPLMGSQAIFFAGFKHLAERYQDSSKAVVNSALIDNIQRAMRIAHTQQVSQLEQPLNYLATVGSTSPYIGLLGTVWGIMHALQALGQLQQATLTLVAPGISEALMTTALGLFVAIPAVIAYNRFANQVEIFNTQFATFQETFLGWLLCQNTQAHHSQTL